jgi:type II secretory pathway pseudopilin PulG
MPTCERRRRAPAVLPRRGFAYLGLLFLLVIGGAALAALGSHWQQQARREREAELLFRGCQLRDALQRYAAATPAGQPRAPQRLDELLSDQRGEPPLHHLRRLWPDPFTGQPDWVLLRDARGGIVGLHSRSQQPALRRQGLPPGVPVPAQGLPRLADWRFIADGAAAAAPPQTDSGRDTR